MIIDADILQVITRDKNKMSSYELHAGAELLRYKDRYYTIVQDSKLNEVRVHIVDYLGRSYSDRKYMVAMLNNRIIVIHDSQDMKAAEEAILKR